MKKNFSKVLFSATVAASMMFAACGSDDASSNVERDEDSSSSAEESSSSEKVTSSSSVEEDEPEGERSATLDDLSAYYVLDDMFGTKAILATGSKRGVFSLWISDTAWIALRSDFKDGKLEYGTSNGSFQGASTKEAEAMEKFFTKGGKFHFVVKDNQLQYSLDGKNYEALRDTSLRSSLLWITEGTDLDALTLTCKSGKDTHVYNFYKGRFLVEDTESDTTRWSAGYYDIQKDNLLLLPVYYYGPVYALTTAHVEQDYTIEIVAGETYGCKKSSNKYSEFSREKLVGEWNALVEKSEWVMDLKEDGSYVIESRESAKEVAQRKGVWDVYGDQLLLSPVGVKGKIKSFKEGKSFTFEHAEMPEMPTDWTIAVKK